MMRRLTLLPLAAAAGLLLAACGNMAAAPTTPQAEYAFPSGPVVPAHDPFVDVAGGAPLAEFPAVWFVEVGAAPRVDGGSIGTQTAALASVQAAAADAGVTLTPRYVFDTFVSGFSAELSAQDLLTVANLPGVRSVSPVGIVEAPQVERHDPSTLGPDLYTAISMTGADFAVDTLLVDGTGVAVGIIDTGITLDHPEFTGRIVTGFDFVGDLYDAGDPDNDTPLPEGTVGALTRPGGGDCNGHGTHVAGIVGADGVEVQGVAPGVSLGAYRVFGCDGSSHSDVILAAIEQAYADGMDVVNLSLGSANGFPQDFLAVALSRMIDLGMVPVASAGNNGASGIYTVGSPGAGADVITVASIDNSALRFSAMEVGGELIGYDSLDGAPLPPTSGTTPEIVYVGQGCNADAYLDDPAGQVALVTRGACPFGEKYVRAVGAGAVGVVIENNADGNFFGTLGGTYGPEFGVSISGLDGAFIKSLIGTAPEPFITWTDELVTDANPTGFLASAFSSYGLAPDLSLKPDLAAPGGFITSTYIDGAEPGVAGTPGYAVLSGTSMSSPHVAGAVALMLAGRPDIEPERIRDALLNTADPFLLWSLNPDLGFALESVHRQGAGLVSIPKALLNETYALPAKLSLGESAGGVFVDVVTIHNDSASDVTYDLLQIEDLGYTPIATYGDSDAPGFEVAFPIASFYELRDSGFFDPITEVTVPAGGARSFQVRLEFPTASETAVVGTYLAFLATAGGPGVSDLYVPAAGFVGDYQALPTWSVCQTPDGALGLEPFLANDSFFFLPEGWIYTMRDGDVPTIGFGLAHAADRVTAEFVPQGAGSWIGDQPGFEFELFRRNDPCSVGVYGLGALDAETLPNGEYTVRVSVLKAEGDPTNPAHTAVFETPGFFVDRFATF